MDKYVSDCRHSACSPLLHAANAFMVMLIGVLPLLADKACAINLAPGDGFDCETAQPARIGQPGDYGYDANSIARWDVVPYQLFRGELEVGIVAFHIAGINRVEFCVEGGQWVSVSQMTLNPRTRVNEYWATVDAGDFQDGPIELCAVAYPLKGNPRVLNPLVLYANPKGALTGRTVYVSQGGSDSASGEIESPMATITNAIDKVSGGGTVILMDKGVYELDSGRRIRQKRLNELYITIEPEDGLDTNDVIIGFKERKTCRPYVRRLRFKNVSIDFSTIQQYYPHGTTWFEGCRWYQSEGGAATYKAISYPVRVADHPYYATDSLAEDMLYGFAGAGLARNCTIRRISGDVLQNVQCALNCAVEGIDGTLIKHHTDVLQMTLHGNNRIVYGLDVKDMAGTQCVFLDHYRASHTDYAFVDIAFDCHDARGGPPFTQFNAPNTNILFRNVKWPGQKIIFRTDFAPPKQFVGRNVVFESCRLYPTDYTRYVVSGKVPQGVIFRDCYSAPREPGRTLQPSAAAAASAGTTTDTKEVYEGRQLTFALPVGDAVRKGSTYVARDMPKGATFSGGAFDWTPGYDQAGTYEVTFMPVDTNSTTAQPITITISVWNAGRSPGPR